MEQMYLREYWVIKLTDWAVTPFSIIKTKELVTGDHLIDRILSLKLRSL